MALSDLQPPWVLAGGAALVGFYLPHRTTRDLDLFWKGLTTLGRIPEDAADILRAVGLDVATLQTSPAFCRQAVRSATESCVVDLVAVPGRPELAPEMVRVGEHSIRVEPRQQILVSKLCALLGRSEIRDLQDVQALVESGADIEVALRAAPALDGGFSPIVLAQLLDGLPLSAVAPVVGLSPEEVTKIIAFREWLVAHLVRTAAAR